MFSLVQLRVFTTVARTRSFTAAAAELHMAQPSVGEFVRRLENEYGTRLFVRGGRRLVMTEAGETLLPVAVKVTASADEADRTLRAITSLEGGVASFGLLRNAKYYRLGALLAQFHARYPSVRLRIVGLNSVEVASAVADGELEAGTPDGLRRAAVTRTRTSSPSRSAELNRAPCCPRRASPTGPSGRRTLRAAPCSCRPTSWRGSADNDLLIGEHLALDPAEFFVIATELLGNGVSSSPTNTPPPFDGPRFPVTTIRDTVEPIRRLLAEQLGVEHLAVVVGFSMGAMQAFSSPSAHPASLTASSRSPAPPAATRTASPRTGTSSTTRSAGSWPTSRSRRRRSSPHCPPRSGCGLWALPTDMDRGTFLPRRPGKAGAAAPSHRLIGVRRLGTSVKCRGRLRDQPGDLALLRMRRQGAKVNWAPCSCLLYDGGLVRHVRLCDTRGLFVTDVRLPA